MEMEKEINAQKQMKKDTEEILNEIEYLSTLDEEGLDMYWHEQYLQAVTDSSIGRKMQILIAQLPRELWIKSFIRYGTK